MIEMLHPWVAFVIMPVFALANAGIVIGGGSSPTSGWTVIVAVGVGLAIGKPGGILLGCWLAIRLSLATVQEGLSVRHLAVLGAVAGVGFTMALFIADLAFLDPDLLAAAKLGVLLASGGAALLALTLGRVLLSLPRANATASSDART